jgi:predicted O-methyltransferase YrrM
MGHAYQSPLRRRDVLAGLIKQMGAKTFVEVGCKEGRTTGYLLKEFPDLRAIAIDPWAPVPNSDEDYKGWDFEAIEREFWENVGEAKDRVEMLRMPSAAAAASVCVRVIPPPPDIVFIDAAHDYRNVVYDIRAWWPIVRNGGYLCGHDYQHKFPGVMRAVADCFPLLRVAVCPDSVWVVQKDDCIELREAA